MSKYKSIIITGIVTSIATFIASVLMFHYANILETPQRVIIENLSDLTDELIKLKESDPEVLSDVLNSAGIVTQQKANGINNEERTMVPSDSASSQNADNSKIPNHVSSSQNDKQDGNDNTDESSDIVKLSTTTPTIFDNFTSGLSKNWNIANSSDGWISYTDSIGLTNSIHHEAHRSNTIGYGGVIEYSYANGGNTWLSLDTVAPTNYSIKVDIKFNEYGFVENSVLPDKTFSRGGFFFNGSVDEYNIMRASYVLLSANLSENRSGVVTGVYNTSYPDIQCLFNYDQTYSFRAIIYGNKGDAYLDDHFLCSFDIETEDTYFGLMTLGYAPTFTNFEFTILDEN